MGLVKRKGNTKAKIQVENFEELKKLFVQDVKTVMVMDELVFKWNQTGLKYVPVSEWTKAEEGSKRVEIDGKDNKQLFLSALWLVIFFCHSCMRERQPYEFPEKWSIANHWCNEDNMELYIHNIILPYLSETRSKLKLSPDHPALLLFDNFKGQCTKKLLRLLDSSNVSVILIPANCTDRLQPLDLSINKATKEFCAKHFRSGMPYKCVLSLMGKPQQTQLTLE